MIKVICTNKNIGSLATLSEIETIKILCEAILTKKVKTVEIEYEEAGGQSE